MHVSSQSQRFAMFVGVVRANLYGFRVQSSVTCHGAMHIDDQVGMNRLSTTIHFPLAPLLTHQNQNETWNYVQAK